MTVPHRSILALLVVSSVALCAQELPEKVTEPIVVAVDKLPAAIQKTIQSDVPAGDPVLGAVYNGLKVFVQFKHEGKLYLMLISKEGKKLEVYQGRLLELNP